MWNDSTSCVDLIYTSLYITPLPPCIGLRQAFSSFTYLSVSKPPWPLQLMDSCENMTVHKSVSQAVSLLQMEWSSSLTSLMNLQGQGGAEKKHQRERERRLGLFIWNLSWNQLHLAQKGKLKSKLLGHWDDKPRSFIFIHCSRNAVSCCHSNEVFCPILGYF